MEETTNPDRTGTEDEVVIVPSNPDVKTSRPDAFEAVSAPVEPVAPVAPVAPVVVEQTSPTVSPARGVLRIALVAVGAAGMIVGAFLEWVNGIHGIDLSNRVFFTTHIGTTGTFLASAGAVAIAIGLVAMIGLAPIGGWLVRLAGIAGIIGFVLSVISMARVGSFSLPQDIGIGLWLVLVGSVVTLIAGFVPATGPVARPTATNGA